MLRYRAFKDEVRLKMRDIELDGASVMFLLPMPSSWSKRKRAQMLGKGHRQKPDLDNLLKALSDALHIDDAHIAFIRAGKRWAPMGAIGIMQDSCGDYGGWIGDDHMTMEGCGDANVL